MTFLVAINHSLQSVLSHPQPSARCESADILEIRTACSGLLVLTVQHNHKRLRVSSSPQPTLIAPQHGPHGGRLSLGRGQLLGRSSGVLRRWLRAAFWPSPARDNPSQRGRPGLAVRVRRRRRRGGARAAAGARRSLARIYDAAHEPRLSRQLAAPRPPRGSLAVPPRRARRFRCAYPRACPQVHAPPVAYEASPLLASHPLARAPPKAKGVSSKGADSAGGAAAGAHGAGKKSGGKKPRKELCPPGCRVVGCADRSDWLPYNSRACRAAGRAPNSAF